MTIRLHLGGSRHGKLIDVPDSWGTRAEYRRAVAFDWVPGQHEAPQIGFERESYEAVRVGFFGRTLSVMFLEGTTPDIRDEWAYEYLVSTFVKTLIGEGER